MVLKLSVPNCCDVSEGMICSLQEIGISSNYIPKSFELKILMFLVILVLFFHKVVYLDDQVMEFI